MLHVATVNPRIDIKHKLNLILNETSYSIDTVHNVKGPSTLFD